MKVSTSDNALYQQSIHGCLVQPGSRGVSAQELFGRHLHVVAERTVRHHGKHQNVWDEINRNYIQEKHIKVVRRYSGGGAVYHDSGNLNITFIQNSKELASGTFTAR